MKLKIIKPLHGHAVGDIITIPDNKGIPLDMYWRARLKDAKKDNCVEIVPSKSSTQTKSDKKEDSK